MNRKTEMPYPILKFEFNKNHYYDSSWFHNFFYEDYYGNLLSKEKYKYAKSFNEGYAFVYKYDKSWDIINTVGDSVLDSFKYSRIIKIALKHISPKDYFFIKNYKIGHNLILSVDCVSLKKELDDKNFKIKYYPETPADHGHLLINIYTGALSLLEDYSMAGSGLIAIKHFNDDWTYISLESFNNHWLEKAKFQTKFEFACAFKYGLAKAKKEGYFGFIGTNGNFVINPVYDDARSFSEGYAAVAIANCRKFDNWNNSTKISDLAWNFIDKNNKIYLSRPKDHLSRIDEKQNYYFEDSSSIYTSAYANLNPDYFKELSLEGIVCSNNFIGRPHRDFWYNSTVLGQLSPRYIADLLTAQITDELGFKKWFVDLSNQSTNAYLHLQSRKKVIAETFYIDFDTTQMEFDYINGSNGLEAKYGFDYTSGNWKTKKNTSNYSSGGNYNDITDWSNYNDDLDMDQQSIDFWNQF